MAARALQRALFCLDLNPEETTEAIADARVDRLWVIKIELRLPSQAPSLTLAMSQREHDAPVIEVLATTPLSAGAASASHLLVALNNLHRSSHGVAVCLASSGPHLEMRSAALLAGLDDDEDRCRTEVTLNVLLQVLAVARRVAHLTSA